MNKVGYHTQEKWPERLNFPVLCDKNTAWLGIGYYFWLNKEDAILWGVNSKSSYNGYFEIYESVLNTSNMLDTAFNESDYYRFANAIKEAQNRFDELKESYSILELFEYVKSNYLEKHIDGIIFDDKPYQKRNGLRQQNGPPYFKRIQIVVYNKECVLEFKFLEEKGV